MHANVVLTLTGTDRIGIVEEVTKSILDLGGNIETSRMARLAGEFAILLLVAIPSEQLANLAKCADNLVAQGFKVTTSQTRQSYAEAHPGWMPYQIQVHGADHEGIVHDIARTLSQRGINIESVDTGTIPAPISGSPLFSMIALVLVPPSLLNQNWQAALEDVGHHLGVDVQVSAVEPE